MIRNCKVCGASYKTCYSCEKERSWRLHTDTPEHYYIWTVLMGYQANHDAKQAYSALRKRGIDLRNTAEYTPSVQALLAEIYALAHENSRAKKAVVEAEETKAEEQVNIAGVASGTVAGSADVQGGSGGGTGGSGIKLNLTSGSFKGTEYSYTAKESNLEDFISQIELDVSKYQDAISQIDGQIAALQALKNAPLKSFKSDTKSGSSSKKDVEEYVATIDDYWRWDTGGNCYGRRPGCGTDPAVGTGADGGLGVSEPQVPVLQSGHHQRGAFWAGESWSVPR